MLKRCVPELKKGAVVVFSGNVLGRALGFPYHFLPARLLGASTYGIFLLGLSIVNLAASVADGGLRWGCSVGLPWRGVGVTALS